jgi:hypothetical protein
MESTPITEKSSVVEEKLRGLVTASNSAMTNGPNKVILEPILEKLNDALLEGEKVAKDLKLQIENQQQYRQETLKELERKNFLSSFIDEVESLVEKINQTEVLRKKCETQGVRTITNNSPCCLQCLVAISSADGRFDHQTLAR